MNAPLIQIESSIGTAVLVAVLTYAAILIVMRRRFVHLLEPAVIQLLIVSCGFAAFFPLYAEGDYAWWAVVAATTLAVLPFVLFYRRKGVLHFPHIIEDRKAFAETLEFRSLLVISIAVIVLHGALLLSSTGFSPLQKSLAATVTSKAVGVLSYLNQPATSLLPPFLLLTFRTRWFYFVLVAFLLGVLVAIVQASRTSILLPILLSGAALFLAKLDRDSATGAQVSFLNGRNILIGVLGIIAAFALMFLFGSVLTGTARLFFWAFIVRFFDSFDALCNLIYFGLISPHLGPDYSVLLAYTQPIHKILQLDVGLMFNNIGEYIAARAYGLDIWRYPEFGKLPLSNSAMPAEFLLSYNLPLALALIPIYSTLVVSLLNWCERRRYRGIITFGVSQYLLMTSVQYIMDGGYFIMGAYALVLLTIAAKAIAYGMKHVVQINAERPSPAG